MTTQFRKCPVSCPIAASSQPQRSWRSWALSATTTALVLSAASAVALTSAAPPIMDQPIFLTLPQAPAATESVAAISDPAPIASAEAPSQMVDNPPEADTPPDLPTAQPLAKPDAPTQPAPEQRTDAKPTPPEMPLPPPDPLPAPDAQPAAAEPPPPAPKPQEAAKPAVKKAEAKPKQVEKKPAKTKKAKEPAPKKTAKASAAAPNSGGATATAKAAKAAAQGPSPAAYQKAVMKKVKATPKRAGAGKGRAVVGFAISANGGLALVKIVKSSGSAALDAAAMDHIQRAAPFPAPPAGVAARFSFEFVGK